MKQTFKFVLIATIAIILSVACTGRKKSEEYSGKDIYIPKEFADMNFNDTLSRYCYERMDTTPNLVFFWEKGFGKDITKAPMLDSTEMTFDFEGLKATAERFYVYYRDTLKFIAPGSLADKYRMMVMINYSKEGTAYGGAYDNTIGAIWVTPMRLHEKKFNCIAHEIGHAFQAQIAADGLTSASGPLWEITSQWMLFHVNPDWMTDENYHWKNYMRHTHIYPFSEQTMYCNPYLAEYWSSKHGLEIMSRIWRNNTDVHDPILIYQSQTGIGQKEFNNECFDAALHFITYDLDRIRPYAKPYRNAHVSRLVPVEGEDNCYKISDKMVPQCYGYNGVALEVPEPGSEVTISLSGEMPEDIKGEWNYALLPIKNDSVADYSAALRSFTVDGKGKEIRYTVPQDGLSHLWLVVNAVPETHNAQKTKTAWKYSVTINGTVPQKIKK
jgi:hypothetical protein